MGSWLAPCAASHVLAPLKPSVCFVSILRVNLLFPLSKQRPNSLPEPDPNYPQVLSRDGTLRGEAKVMEEEGLRIEMGLGERESWSMSLREGRSEAGRGTEGASICWLTICHSFLPSLGITNPLSSPFICSNFPVSSTVHLSSAVHQGSLQSQWALVN